MKKSFFGILTLFLLLNLALPNQEKLGTKTVTILTTEYPPYVIVNKDGSVGGVSCFVAEELMKAAGYKTNFNVVPYKRAVAMLKSQEDAVMMGMFSGVPGYDSLEVSEILYTVFPTTLFYNENLKPEFSKFNKPADIKGKSVSVMQGTNFYEKIVTDQGGIVQRVNRESQVIKLANIGRVDFGHTGLLTGAQAIEANKEYKNVKPVSFLMSSLNSGLMFRKGAYSVKKDFLNSLKMLHKNGGLLKIYTKALKEMPKADPNKLVPKEIVFNINSPKAK